VTHADHNPAVPVKEGDMGDKRHDAASVDEQHAADIDEPGPAGGSETTEEQLDADNAVEEDTLKAVEGDAPSA